jgi:hypothetical protein
MSLGKQAHQSSSNQQVQMQNVAVRDIAAEKTHITPSNVMKEAIALQPRGVQASTASAPHDLMQPPQAHLQHFRKPAQPHTMQPYMAPQTTGPGGQNHHPQQMQPIKQKSPFIRSLFKHRLLIICIVLLILLLAIIFFFATRQAHLAALTWCIST